MARNTWRAEEAGVDWGSWRSSVRFLGGGGGRPVGGLIKRGKFAVENAKPSSDNPVTVRDLNPHLDDFHFAQECLEGKSSSLSYFQENYRPKLLAFLKRQGASPDEASEIVENMWAECVAPTPTARPKLERYQGGCALESWLHTIVLNTLITRRRREKIVRTVDPKPQDGQERDDGPWKGTAEEVELDPAPLLALLRSAIDTAFKECSPEDFVLLQLAHCDQLKEKELAVMFRCDVATICRRLQRAQKGINRSALRHVKEADPLLHLKWEDFMDLCRSAGPSYFVED
jgi:RNA polymerase sigma factor (sigma-70 family)